MASVGSENDANLALRVETLQNRVYALEKVLFGASDTVPASRVVVKEQAVLARARQLVVEWQRIAQRHPAVAQHQERQVRAALEHSEHYLDNPAIGGWAGAEHAAKLEVIKAAKGEVDGLLEGKEALQRLTQYVNPDSTTSQYSEAMRSLDQSSWVHLTQHEKARQLNDRFTHLVSAYSKLMQLLSLKFAYWEHQLSANENAANSNSASADKSDGAT